MDETPIKIKWKIHVFYTWHECQVLKLLLIIIYKIQPPSSFISYLLFYIFLFNGFTHGDLVVLCTKTSTIITTLCIFRIELLKIYFKRSLRLPSFCSGSTKSDIPQVQAKLSAFIFKHLHGRQCKASATLLLIALPQLCFNLIFESDDLMFVSKDGCQQERWLSARNQNKQITYYIFYILIPNALLIFLTITQICYQQISTIRSYCLKNQSELSSSLSKSAVLFKFALRNFTAEIKAFAQEQISETEW